MKYLKHVSEYILENNINNFDYFFLVTRDIFLDQITNRKLGNLQGISSSPEIINKWFDIRDIMIVMPKEETLRLNDIKEIKYFDYDLLTKDNFKVLRRLKSNKGDYAIESTIRELFKASTNQLNYHKNYFKQDKFIQKNPLRHDIMIFLKRRNFNIADGIKQRINNGYHIDNYKDFLDITYDVILNDTKTETTSNVPYGDTPFDVNKLNKEVLSKVLKSSLSYLGYVFSKESEWIVNNDIFTVPKNSKLVIKQDVGNYKDRFDTRGFEPERIEKIFNKYPNLEKEYEVILVDNRREAYNIFK